MPVSFAAACWVASVGAVYDCVHIAVAKALVIADWVQALFIAFWKAEAFWPGVVTPGINLQGAAAVDAAVAELDGDALAARQEQDTAEGHTPDCPKGHL